MIVILHPMWGSNPDIQAIGHYPPHIGFGQTIPPGDIHPASGEFIQPADAQGRSEIDIILVVGDRLNVAVDEDVCLAARDIGGINPPFSRHPVIPIYPYIGAEPDISVGGDGIEHISS